MPDCRKPTERVKKGAEKPARLRLRRLGALGCLLSFLSCWWQPAAADVTDFNAFPMKIPQRVAPPEPDIESKPDMVFKHTELNFLQIQPYSLEGTKIPGLSNKSVQILAYDHFVVVNNSPFKTLAEPYQEDRLKGKPNFVTADSVIHPYLAYTNEIHAYVLNRYVIQDLRALLYAMLQGATKQYADSEDDGVRADDETICAYLIVALRLLDPSVPRTGPGASVATAEADLRAASALRMAPSAVLGHAFDFSALRPMGWYNGDPRLAAFYRCYHWLSQTKFALSDTSTESKSTAPNEFRRSVLLFNSLQNAKVGSITGMDLWKRIAESTQTLGMRPAAGQLLLPLQYDAVFRVGQKLSLNGLQEPFYRTKLLLSLRRQRPVEVGTASIFDVREQKRSIEENASFTLFPDTDDIELSWLERRGHEFPQDIEEGPDLPVALLSLFLHGSVVAGNILNDSIWHLNPNVADSINSLLKQIKDSSTQNQNLYSMEAGRWAIISSMLRPYSEGAQEVCRGSNWATRRLESAFGVWVDGQLSITGNASNKGTSAGGAASKISTAPGAPTQADAAMGKSLATPAGTAAGALRRPDSTGGSPGAQVSASGGSARTMGGNGTTSATTAVTTPGAATLVPAVPAGAAASNVLNSAPFQYLDPCPDVFRKIASDAEQLSAQLIRLGYLTTEQQGRLQDFTKLALRLAGIADRECGYQPIGSADMELIGNIDRVLAKLVVPVEGTIYMNAGDTTKGGCNLGLGRAGQIFVLCHTTKGVMLCRGGVYTYYEFPGRPITADGWERKLQAGAARPPRWVAEFDAVQERQQASAGL